MGCLCRLCLKCGEVCCGCLPLRMAAFISCLCMFVSSFAEAIGEMYLIKPMMKELKDQQLELFLLISGKVTQLGTITTNLFMTFAVWKKIPVILNVTSILYGVLKGLKLCNSGVESYIHGKGYSFLWSGVASVVVFLLPVIWGYKKQIKKEKAEEATAAETNEGEENPNDPIKAV